MIKKILISEIVTDAGTQTRVETNEKTIESYSEEMKDGVRFPPIIVFHDGKTYYCADGFHRILAASRIERNNIDCDVRKGSLLDAIKFALGANASHGLRRTNADKNNAVEIACKNFADVTDREIARICAVSQPFVSKIRPQVITVITSNDVNALKSSVPPRRIGKSGKSYSTPPPRPSKGISSIPPRKSTAEATIEVCDATGLPIPEEIIGFWDRNGEVQELMSHVSSVRSKLRHAQEKDDPLFREINFTDAIANLNQVYTDLERAKCHAVCPDCSGIAPSLIDHLKAGGKKESYQRCATCKGRGFVSKFFWETCVPIEIRNLRNK